MRALLSVWDKTGIDALAAALHDRGFEIVSTGGTLRAIEAAGVPVVSVSAVTGFPEMMDGRVKTLHPAIHGGLLARRDRPDDLAAIQNHSIEPIDLLVANLYPFGDVVRRPGTTLDDALEHIDIGGPAMIRAAAKNYPGVIVLVDPADYEPVLEALRRGGPTAVTIEQRRDLAAKAFAHVAAYDAVIAEYLRDGTTFPRQLTLAGRKLSDLRYGENPHQSAALYELSSPRPTHGVAGWRLLGGKEMSYNNYLDADAAVSAAFDFPEATVAIVKHNVPCGIASYHEPAIAETDADMAFASRRCGIPAYHELEFAFQEALASDPVSAFGGIVAANQPIDARTAELVAEHFFEVVIAPGFEPAALDLLRRKKNLRIIEIDRPAVGDPFEVRLLDGAFLAQTPDHEASDPAAWRVVTRREPTATERDALAFAWRVVRHVKSNAIVLAQRTATVGVGGGQPNRVDAVRIAVERAGERADGSVLASDAFFPFADGVEAAAKAGVRAIIQPGGSVRDKEVIAAADEAGIAMIFTGTRHFRH